MRRWARTPARWGWSGTASAPPTSWSIDNARAVSAVTSGLWVAFKPGKPGAPWDIVGIEAAAGGDPNKRWRVAYEDLKTPGDADPTGRYSFPNTIRVAEPGRDFDDGVEISVKDRKLNPSFRPQAFQLSPPEGYQVQIVPGCQPVSVRWRLDDRTGQNTGAGDSIPPGDNVPVSPRAARVGEPAERDTHARSRLAWFSGHRLSGSARRQLR